MQTEVIIKPKYVHSCDLCIFLGRFKGADLYYHDDVEDMMGTPYIARYGSEGGDYFAGYSLEIEDPELLTMAKKYAYEKLKYDPLKYEKNPSSRPAKALTVKDVRSWDGVEEVFEILGVTSEHRWLWVKVSWWLWPSSKDLLQQKLHSYLPAHTKSRVIRYSWELPPDAVYAYDD